ncbi:jg14821, partial [Pararge aegeria aegeria]
MWVSLKGQKSRKMLANEKRMQMQAMNQYGNRGYGGAPQPQRQGRRGNNRGGPGGFRNNSRFDHNQRNSNQQGGQRPTNESNQQDEPPATLPPQKPQPAKPKEEIQQAPPQPKQQSQPPKQAPKPQQNPPQQQPPIQQQPQTQNQQPKPLNQQSKPQTQDIVDKSVAPNETKHQNQNNQGGYQKGGQPLPRLMDSREDSDVSNMNGNFGGGNRQSGWSQGGPNNRQGGGNGGNFGQKGFGPKHGGQGQGQGPARNQQRNSNRNQQDGKSMPREEHMLANKLKDLMGPLVDLPPIDQTEAKFNGRSRLYIGNLSNDVTEEEIMNMFSQFGEPAELFINKEKNFGFIKMDYRVNAEKARRELDGKMRNGRTLRVRFAPHNSTVRVKNLPPFVSNELLYRSFEIFGKIERAYVKIDERGKTVGEGIVEFARKPSALAAIRNCTERCFFLTSSLRPVIVENFEEPDEADGYPEKNLPKKHPEYMRSREVGPRFSEPGSFEHEYGTRWKQLHELHRQKEDALKKELAAEEEKLEAQMEYAKYEHETELLREQLRQREQDRER